MKKTFISIGLALLYGICALIIAFIFLEGWTAKATITANIVVFFIAGFLLTRFRPASFLYSGLVIVLPTFLLLGGGLGYFKELFKVLAEPSKIDYRNFYILIPMIALISAYLGALLGKYMAGRSHPLPLPADH